MLHFVSHHIDPLSYVVRICLFFAFLIWEFSSAVRGVRQSNLFSRGIFVPLIDAPTCCFRDRFPWNKLILRTSAPSPFGYPRHALPDITTAPLFSRSPQPLPRRPAVRFLPDVLVLPLLVLVPPSCGNETKCCHKLPPRWCVFSCHGR